jgi:hypothetical protein
MNVPDTNLTKIKVTLCLQVFCFSMYPLVSKLYSIAVIQPLSTADEVGLIKTSHRANIKTETLSVFSRSLGISAERVCARF